MKKFLICILVSLLFVITSSTVCGMDNYDKLLLGTRLIDWKQTLEIADNPDRYHELNPILGEHPSTIGVNNYFIGLIGLDYGFRKLAEWKPERFERLNDRWVKLNLIVEFSCIGNNLSLGINVFRD